MNKTDRQHPSSAIAVVGSLNIDLIASVNRLPRPGETVVGQKLERRFGGKGANQAVAAARQKTAVSLVGCVGNDADGNAYLNHLKSEGIDTTSIRIVSGETTGTALIAVDANAENEIIVVPGANSRLSAAQVRRFAPRLASSRVLLLQFEVPMPAVLEAIKIANAANVPVILNPSPLRPDFPWGQVSLQTVIVNSIEAKQIFRLTPADSAAVWRACLKRNSISRLVITRGRFPTLCLDENAIRAVPTVRVKPVDTVGAGDAFAGTYAASVATGCDFHEAVKRGNHAGAMATLKHGAQ